MKAIVKVKNITNVITNSSSEVFIAENDGDDLMDWDWMRSQEGRELFDRIIEIAELPMSDSLIDRLYNGLMCPTVEEVEEIFEKYKDKIQEKVIDRKLYWTEIPEDENGEFPDPCFDKVVWSDIWR